MPAVGPGLTLDIRELADLCGNYFGPEFEIRLLTVDFEPDNAAGNAESHGTSDRNRKPVQQFLDAGE